MLALSPGVRQTVKTLFAVRWNCIVLRRRFPARCVPAGEAEAGSAGAVARARGAKRGRGGRCLDFFIDISP